jgi:hypothetical protein
MQTLGDILHATRIFFSLQRTPAQLKAARTVNPVTSDYPPGGKWSGVYRWEEERQARLALYTGWTLAGLQRIGLAALLSQLLVKRRVGEDVEDIKNHPIELLTQFPNPDTSREYLWLHTIYSLYLRAAYWFLYPDQRGDIGEIWPMPFNRVRPVPNDDPNPERLFKGFIYTTSSGKEIPVATDNVVYLRFPDPLDPYGALPPMKALMRPVARDNAQAEWDTALFDENKGIPAHIFAVPADMDNDQLEVVRRDLKANIGQNMVTRAGTISVQFAQETHEQMQFLESRTANQKEIFTILGVPEDATNQDAWRWFINNTVWPVLTMIAGQITTQLTRPYFGDDIFAEFEDIRPQDRSLEVQESVQYAPFRSYNEERETRGEKALKKVVIPEHIEGYAGLSLYDDVPSKLVDTLLPLIVKGKPEPVPPQLVDPSTEQGFAGPPSLPGSAGAAHQQEQMDDEANPDKREMEGETQVEEPEEATKATLLFELIEDWQKIALKRLKAGKSPAHIYFHAAIDESQSYELAAVLGHCRTEAAVKAVFAHLDEYTNLKAQLGTPVTEIPKERLEAQAGFVDPVQEWLEAEAERVAYATKPNGEPPEQSFWDNEAVLLAAFLTPFVGRWMDSAVSEAVKRINPTGLGVDATVNAKAAHWANAHSLEMAKGLTATTRELSKAKINQWFAAGGRDVSTLKQSLGEIISPQWRANLIAQTETSRAFASARQSVAQELGIVKGFTFVGLEALCPICRGLNGKRRALNGLYPGGYLVPVHPRCGCDEDMIM